MKTTLKCGIFSKLLSRAPGRESPEREATETVCARRVGGILDIAVLVYRTRLRLTGQRSTAVQLYAYSCIITARHIGSGQTPEPRHSTNSMRGPR